MFTWTDLLRRTAATAALCGALGIALHLVVSAAAGIPGFHLWLAAAIALSVGVVLMAISARAWRVGAFPIGRRLLLRSERPREFLFWTIWHFLCGGLSLALFVWTVAQLVRGDAS